jgi:hypothetical protein
MSTFKRISARGGDVTQTKTKLHEVIPITGSIVSGTYSDNNIKTYAHGMFTSVYDYPYLSSSANHIFDVTAGVWPDGDYGTSGTTPVSASGANATEKYNIFSQMSQLLVGHDETGSIRPFDHLGEITSSTTNKFQTAIIVPFARLLVKDEIEKGTFSMTAGFGTYATPFSDLITFQDLGATTAYKNNSPAGEYGLLYTGSTVTAKGDPVGLVYYQAGLAILEASSSAGGYNFFTLSGVDEFIGTGITYEQSFVSGTIDQLAAAFNRRIQNVSFNNTTELNSTIYFCRANNKEFNYSSNPTYLSASEIVVKNGDHDHDPVSYVTTVGLYDDDNELLATAKLSEPLQKSPTTELTIRVRLDY